jgi:phage-related minor tail protein
MSDSYGFDFVASRIPGPDELPDKTDKTNENLKLLGISATQFSNAISKAFAQATTGGKQFDDVLKGLALKLSGLAVQNALKPVLKGLFNGFEDVFKDGGTGGSGPVMTAFAAGGVINTPSYFPLSGGGLGLAGEAGPEAIVPLSRGSDGRLGIAGGGGQGGNITVQIVTPDPGSFRRSEAYLTGQIARAVARGQRGF